jgi:hypothetical protein
MPWDWPTIPLRPLPSFILAGVGKSSTTSLYHYLVRHPQTIPCRKKAPHFFNKRFEKGIGWYRRQFPVLLPSLWRRPTHAAAPLVFEASASYFTSPRVPGRVAKVIPWAKIVVILRSPVDRAFSNYQHNLRKGRENRSFEEAIDWELEQGASATAPDSYGQDYYRFYFGYLYRGQYVDHLRNWLEFFPWRKIKIIRAEDYFADPAGIFLDLLEFLELSSWRPERFEKINSGGDYPKVSSHTRERLEAYFRSYNSDLFQLLGRDLGW